MDKFAKKMTTSVVALSASLLFAIPAFAAADVDDVAINYSKEQVTGVEYGMEYNIDETGWVPVFGTKLDLSAEIGTKTAIAIRVIGSDAITTTAHEYKVITIGTRPAALASSDAKFQTSASGTHADTIATTGTVEYKTGKMNWKAVASDAIPVGNAELTGEDFSIRKAAENDAYASEPFTVNVPKQESAPSLTYDLNTDSIEIPGGVTVEYIVLKTTATAAAPNSSDTWAPITGGAIGRTEFDGGNGTGSNVYVYVREKGETVTNGTADASKAASAIVKIEVPKAVPAAPAAVLNLTDEKVTAVSDKMEYRYLTTAQDANETLIAPEWTAVSGTQILMTDDISKNNAGADAKTKLQIRLKAVKPKTGAPTPASAYKEFTLAERPATTTGTVHFDTELITGLATTDEYKIGTAAWKAVDATADEDDDDAGAIDVSTSFPAAGKDPVTVLVRTKAISTVSGDKVTGGTPASITQEIALPARPAAPTPAYTDGSYTVTGVDATMEFAVYDEAGTEVTTAFGAKPISGTSFTLADAAYTAGTKYTVKVRTKAITSAVSNAGPASLPWPKVITIPTPAYSGMKLFQSSTTGLATTEIATGATLIKDVVYFIELTVDKLWAGSDYVAVIEHSGGTITYGTPVLVKPTTSTTATTAATALSSNEATLPAIASTDTKIYIPIKCTKVVDTAVAFDVTLKKAATAIGTKKSLATIKVDLAPVTNTAGSGATPIVYAGGTIDLSGVANLFTISADAGDRTYTVESTTGTGTIGADKKTLTVTKAGTFVIGVETAATNSHAAGAKVTANLTVNKGVAPAKPVGTPTNVTVAGNDGKITITSPAAGATYEISKGAGAYTKATVTDGAISGLEPDSYTIRIAESDLYNASEASAIIVIGIEA